MTPFSQGIVNADSQPIRDCAQVDQYIGKFFIDRTGYGSRPDAHLFVLADCLEQLADFLAEQEALLHDVAVAEAALLFHLRNITLKIIKCCGLL
jgi:hypothetical protein